MPASNRLNARVKVGLEARHRESGKTEKSAVQLPRPPINIKSSSASFFDAPQNRRFLHVEQFRHILHDARIRVLSGWKIGKSSSRPNRSRDDV